MNPNKRVGRLQISMEFVYSILGLKSVSRLTPLYMSVDNERNILNLFVSSDELSEVKEGYEIPVIDIEYAKNLSTPLGQTVIIAHNLDSGKIVAKEYGFNINDVFIVTGRNSISSLRGLRRPNILFANGWHLIENIDEIMQELKALDY